MAYTAEDFTSEEQEILVPSLAAQISDYRIGYLQLDDAQRQIAEQLMDRFLRDGNKPLALAMAAVAIDMSHVSRRIQPHGREELARLHAELTGA